MIERIARADTLKNEPGCLGDDLRVTWLATAEGRNWQPPTDARVPASDDLGADIRRQRLEPIVQRIKAVSTPGRRGR